ncbi:hypothetical protein ABI59_19970 [Acidobacteria bacterium Mor1]|nr:hypothetical protein ABI59_19970 [Acidobacteria bacterium Mor1]
MNYAAIPALVFGALWQSAAIAIVAVLMLRGLRIQNPSTRSTLLFLAFLAAAIVPLWALIPLADATEPVAAPFDAGFAGRVPSGEAPERGTAAPTGLPQSFSFSGAGRLLAMIWTVGTLLGATRLIGDWMAIRRLRRAGRSLGRSGDLEVLAVPSLPGPMAAGILRKVILLPEAWVHEEGSAEFGWAMAHERAHHLRRDLLAHAVEAVLLCAFWWNPVLHRLRKEIEAQREMACDDQAVLECRDPQGYASALITCAEFALAARSARTRPMALGAASAGSQLARRVERLLDGGYRIHRGRARGPAAAALSGIAAACLVSAAAAPPIEVLDPTRETVDGVAEQRNRASSGRDLVRAAVVGDLAEARRLLSRGADIDAVLELDGTPLIAAVNQGNRVSARWLISQGADVDAYALYDETALISAVRRGDLPMVRLLLDAGADPDLAAATQHGYYRTPMGEAGRLRRDDIADLLIRYGARP